MSEYIFVNLIDKHPVGSETGHSIPLHITLLHWFEFERNPEEIIDAAQTALRSIGRITTTATVEDLFGRDGDTPAMRVDRKPELAKLHTALLGTVNRIGGTLDTKWTGRHIWNPHATHRKGNRLHPCDEVVIDDVDLITRESRHGERKILHRFDLTP